MWESLFLLSWKILVHTFGILVFYKGCLEYNHCVIWDFQKEGEQIIAGDPLISTRFAVVGHLFHNRETKPKLTIIYLVKSMSGSEQMELVLMKGNIFLGGRKGTLNKYLLGGNTYISVFCGKYVEVELELEVVW